LNGRLLSPAIMALKFFYFDLGKVLVDFSVEQMLAQVGAAAGIEPEKVRAILFDNGLMREHESGRLSDRGFHEAFCAAAGARPDYDTLAAAASEIFTLNEPMLPLVRELRQAGRRLGILSNTCAVHWDYCRNHYPLLIENFAVHALSFRLGAVKPDAAIFRAAAGLADVRPDEIFFCDDIAEHVVGARAVGFDAVQFTSAAALADALRQRGVSLDGE
jgi:HAD superfamily hydrolase (TIGR01509 family)